MEDIIIWNKLCAGQKDSLKWIYDRYARDLLHYGCKLCRNRTVAEDALQEIFIQCWERRSTLPEVHNVKSYLYTAIRRRIYRKMAYEPQWESLDGDESKKGEDQIALETGFSIIGFERDDSPGQKKLMTKVRKMIAQLSDRQREIVYLKFIEGMDYEEIAQIMGISYQSSRNLLSKALKNLRNLSVIVLTFVMQF